MPDLFVDDVTLPCASDLTSSRCQCLSSSKDWISATRRSDDRRVSVTEFEPATSCAPGARSSTRLSYTLIDLPSLTPAVQVYTGIFWMIAWGNRCSAYDSHTSRTVLKRFWSFTESPLL